MPHRHTINIDGHLLPLDSPKVMGILNVTPDSFYEQSRVFTVNDIVERAGKMLAEGAAILDVGGYSSRPGAEEVTVADEKNRVLPSVQAIVENFPNAIVSIDTFRSEVAEAALDAGAHLVNDISGGHLDPRMHDLIAERQVPYIVMHMRGTPATMKTLNTYDDLMGELIRYFSDLLDKLVSKGVNDIIIDPGFGFAKDPEQNFELLVKLELLGIAGRPVLIGLSRKSMIYKTLGIEPQASMNGTTALNALALRKGANILRVHDVKEAVEVIELNKKLEISS